LFSHDIAEILLKVELNTITLALHIIIDIRITHSSILSLILG
jgi:hypothetical protein